MTDLVGKLGPFRVAREDLLELARELDRKLPSIQDQSLGDQRFSATVGDYSDACYDVDALRVFLSDLSLVNTVTNFVLVAYSEGTVAPPSEGFTPAVTLRCSSYDAKYQVSGARDVAQANELRDVLVGFRNRHKASRLLSDSGGFCLAAVLVMTMFIAYTAYGICGYSGTFIFDLPCRPLIEYYTIIAGCAVLLVYVIWFTWISRNPPKASFHHSILYLDKEPRNVVWQIVLIIDLVVGILGGIASLLRL